MSQGEDRVDSPRSLVEQFYKKYRLPMRSVPEVVLPADEVRQMRELLREEVAELLKAVDDESLIKIVDGLADVVYVAYGMSLQYGVDLDRAIAAVHHSNMTKADDPEHPWARSGPRKIARGEHYSPPDLAAVAGGEESEGERTRRDLDG